MLDAERRAYHKDPQVAFTHQLRAAHHQLPVHAPLSPAPPAPPTSIERQPWNRIVADLSETLSTPPVVPVALAATLPPHPEAPVANIDQTPVIQTFANSLMMNLLFRSV